MCRKISETNLFWKKVGRFVAWPFFLCEVPEIQQNNRQEYCSIFTNCFLDIIINNSNIFFKI